MIQEHPGKPHASESKREDFNPSPVEITNTATEAPETTAKTPFLFDHSDESQSQGLYETSNETVPVATDTSTSTGHQVIEDPESVFVRTHLKNKDVARKDQCEGRSISKPQANKFPLTVQLVRNQQNEHLVTGLLQILETTKAYLFATTNSVELGKERDRHRTTGWVAAFDLTYAGIGQEYTKPSGCHRHEKFRKKCINVWRSLAKENARGHVIFDTELYKTAAEQLKLWEMAVSRRQNRIATETGEKRKSGEREIVKIPPPAISTSNSPLPTPTATTPPPLLAKHHPFVSTTAAVVQQMNDAVAAMVSNTSGGPLHSTNTSTTARQHSHQTVHVDAVSLHHLLQQISMKIDSRMEEPCPTKLPLKVFDIFRLYKRSLNRPTEQVKLLNHYEKAVWKYLVNLQENMDSIGSAGDTAQTLDAVDFLRRHSSGHSSTMREMIEDVYEAMLERYIVAFNATSEEEYSEMKVCHSPKKRKSATTKEEDVGKAMPASPNRKKPLAKKKKSEPAVPTVVVPDKQAPALTQGYYFPYPIGPNGSFLVQHPWTAPVLNPPYTNLVKHPPKSPKKKKNSKSADAAKNKSDGPTTTNNNMDESKSSKKSPEKKKKAGVDSDDTEDSS